MIIKAGHVHWLCHMRKYRLELKLYLWALGAQGLMNFALCFSLSLTGRQPACLSITGRLGLRSLKTFEPKIATKEGNLLKGFIHVAPETNPSPDLSVWSYCFSADAGLWVLS